MPSLIPNPQPLIPNVFSTGANALLAVLLAPSCAVCSALLEAPLAGCVCRTCWTAVRPITPPVCDRCGDPLARQSQHPTANPESLARGGVCMVCCAGSGAVTRARALGEYEGTLREIVHALKYSARISLARPLAALMRSRCGDVMHDIDYAVPVPLHWRREHRRGFNQARELARHLGPPVLDALTRTRPTRAQVELAAHDRRANVAGAFAIRRRWFRHNDVRGRNVLLIDDVSTTGSTLEECAHVLKDSGASAVFALTAARVITTRPQRPTPNP